MWGEIVFIGLISGDMLVGGVICVIGFFIVFVFVEIVIVIWIVDVGKGWMSSGGCLGVEGIGYEMRGDLVLKLFLVGLI